MRKARLTSWHFVLILAAVLLFINRIGVLGLTSQLPIEGAEVPEN